jgi:AcrR family transcriptional regulator
MQKNRLTEILKASERRFVKHGQAKTTLEEIARDLRIAKSTLYHYFNSKDELYSAVLNKQIKDYLIEIKEIFNNEDKKFQERFRTYLHLKINLNKNYSLIYELMKSDILDNSLGKEEESILGILKEEEQIIKFVFTAYFSDTLNSPKDETAMLFIIQTNMLPFMNNLFIKKLDDDNETLLNKMAEQFEALLNSLPNY